MYISVPEDSQGVVDMSDGRDDAHSDGEDNDSQSMRSKRGKHPSSICFTTFVSKTWITGFIVYFFYCFFCQKILWYVIWVCEHT